jgi:hypothetical protein
MAVESGEVIASDSSLEEGHVSNKKITTIDTTATDNKSPSDATDEANSDSVPEDKTKISATRTSFVTFKTLTSQVVACGVPILSEQHGRVFAILAPAPNDIMWNNIGTRPAYTKKVTYMTSTAYYVGLLFWGVIIAFSPPPRT